MNKVKKDLPIYVLSAALVFLGLTVSGGQANAASSGVSQSDFNRLKNDYDSFKYCVQTAMRQISYYDASRNTRMNYFGQCY